MRYRSAERGAVPIGVCYTRHHQIAESGASSRRKTPYPPVGGRLYVSETLWRETLAWMGHYGAQGAEGLVFWGGTVDSSNATAVSLLAFRHAPQGDTVKLSPEESRALVKTLKALDLKLIAQVHSHRSDWVDHSYGDDHHSASYHEGYWSIIVPRFGSGHPRLEGCGVHEYTAQDGFRRLPVSEVQTRLHLDHSLVLLSDELTAENMDERETRWFWRMWNALKRRQKASV